jgi:hypothetical protein
MTKKEVGVMMACVLLLGSLALRVAIYAIDNYAFDDDAGPVVLQKR